MLAVEDSLIFKFDDVRQPSLCKHSCPLDQQDAESTTVAACPLQSCLYTSIFLTSQACFSLLFLAWNLPFFRQLHHLHHLLTSRIIITPISTHMTPNSTVYYCTNFENQFQGSVQSIHSIRVSPQSQTQSHSPGL